MSAWQLCCVDYSTTPGAPPVGAELAKITARAAEGWEPYAVSEISHGASVTNWRMWFKRKGTRK